VIQNNSFEISIRQNKNKTETSFIATFSTVLHRFVSSQLTFPICFHVPGSTAGVAGTTVSQDDNRLLERLKYLPKGKTILCSILKVFSNFWYR
jgi:hypothetical protein